MTVLQMADLRFGYASDTLFEGVTFSLSIGDRVEKASRGLSQPSSRPPQKAAPATRKESKAKSVALPEADSKQKYEEQRNAARTLEKRKRRIQDLEATIATGEKDLERLRGKLREGPGEDWEKLATMARDEQALAKKVDTMLVEWARLSKETK